MTAGRVRLINSCDTFISNLEPLLTQGNRYFEHLFTERALRHGSSYTANKVRPNACDEAIPQSSKNKSACCSWSRWYCAVALAKLPFQKADERDPARDAVQYWA